MSNKKEDILRVTKEDLVDALKEAFNEGYYGWADLCDGTVESILSRLESRSDKATKKATDALYETFESMIQEKSKQRMKQCQSSGYGAIDSGYVTAPADHYVYADSSGSSFTDDGATLYNTTIS